MLASAIRRAVGIESPVGRTDPISNFWYSPIGGTSSSGIAVTDDVAMSVSTLYACIRILSDSIGILPCFVYEQIDEDTKRRAPEHPYYTTLTSRPNNWMTPLEWKSLAVVHLGLRGNFYNRIIPPGIDSDYWQFVPLNPDKVRVTQQSTGHLSYTHSPDNGPQRTYSDGQILHVKLMSFDGIVGVTPIRHARDTIGLAKARQQMVGGMYKGGGFIKYFLKTTKRLGPEGRKNFRESWRDIHATQPGQPYSPPVLEDDMDLKTLGMSNDDLQTMEAEKISAIEICQFFGVPPHLVFLLDRATFSNIEHQGIEYKTLHLSPWAIRIEQAIESHFASEDPYYVEFLMDALLRGDTKTRYEAYAAALGGRAFATVNEVRRKEGMEPIEGGDELPPPPNQSIPAEGTPAKTESEPEVSVPAPPPVEVSKPFNWKPLAGDAAKRIVDREVKGIGTRASKADEDRGLFNGWVSEWYARHVQYVSECVQPLATAAGVTIPESDFRTYCEEQAAEIGRSSNVPVLLDEWDEHKATRIAFNLEQKLCMSKS